MKFLHCSDLHLGRKPVGSIFSTYSKERYEDYFRAFDFIVDKAVEAKVDAFLISGDLFDRKELSPDVLENAEKILKKLEDNDIPVLCIEGNHDRTVKAGEKSWLEYLSQEGLLFLLAPNVSESGEISYPQWDGEKGSWVEIKGVRFYGVGYQGFLFPEYLKALAPVLERDSQNVILIHTSVGNPDVVTGCVEKDDITPISSKCDYIAGGHIHTKKIFKDVNLFVPGAPEYWDIGESGEKGFFIYDTDKKESVFYDSFRRKKIESSIKVNEGSNAEFFREFRKVLEENPVEEGCLYVLNVRVPFGTFLDVDTLGVERELENLGALKGQISIKLGDVVVHDEKENEFSEIEMLEEEIIKANPFFAFKSSEMTRALKRLKSLHESQDLQEAFAVLDDLFSAVGGEKVEDKHH